jgi:hypothetical protein
MVLEPPAQLLSRRGGRKKSLLLHAKISCCLRRKNAKKCWPLPLDLSRAAQRSSLPLQRAGTREATRARYVLLACVHALALKMIPSRASNSFGTRGGGGRSGAPASRDRATMRAPTPHPPSRSALPLASR